MSVQNLKCTHTVSKLFAKGTSITERKNLSAINSENLRILVIGGKR